MKSINMNNKTQQQDKPQPRDSDLTEWIEKSDRSEPQSDITPAIRDVLPPPTDEPGDTKDDK